MKTAKLPETPKTAEEMWQHSVIGDYLAKYRVSSFHNKSPSALPFIVFSNLVLVM